jgi:hypothetical protein
MALDAGRSSQGSSIASWHPSQTVVLAGWRTTARSPILRVRKGDSQKEVGVLGRSDEKTRWLQLLVSGLGFASLVVLITPVMPLSPPGGNDEAESTNPLTTPGVDDATAPAMPVGMPGGNDETRPAPVAPPGINDQDLERPDAKGQDARSI